MHKLMNRLKARRLFLNITQMQLAADTGVSQPTIAQIELGRITRPRAGTITALARALHVTPGWLEKHDRILPEETHMQTLLNDKD